MKRVAHNTWTPQRVWFHTGSRQNRGHEVSREGLQRQNLCLIWGTGSPGKKKSRIPMSLTSPSLPEGSAEAKASSAQQHAHALTCKHYPWGSGGVQLPLPSCHAAIADSRFCSSLKSKINEFPFKWQEEPRNIPNSLGSQDSNATKPELATAPL